MNMVMNGESWTMTGYGLLPTGTLGCIPKVNSWSDLTSNFFRSLSYELPNLPKIAGITPAGGKMPKCWSVAGSHLSFIYPLIIFIWSLAYGRWDVSPIKLRFISSKWNDPQEPWTYQDSFPPFLIGSGSAKRLKISMFFPGIRDVIFFFGKAIHGQPSYVGYTDLQWYTSVIQHDSTLYIHGFEKPNQKMAYRSAWPQVGKTYSSC